MIQLYEHFFVNFINLFTECVASVTFGSESSETDPGFAGKGIGLRLMGRS